MMNDAAQQFDWVDRLSVNQQQDCCKICSKNFAIDQDVDISTSLLSILSAWLPGESVVPGASTLLS